MEILIGISFFIVYLFAFILGLKQGKQFRQGITPKIELNPIKTLNNYKKGKEKEKEIDLETEGIQNILSYNGRPQKGVK